MGYVSFFLFLFFTMILLLHVVKFNIWDVTETIEIDQPLESLKAQNRDSPSKRLIVNLVTSRASCVNKFYQNYSSLLWRVLILS